MYRMPPPTLHQWTTGISLKGLRFTYEKTLKHTVGLLYIQDGAISGAAFFNYNYACTGQRMSVVYYNIRKVS